MVDWDLPACYYHGFSLCCNFAHLPSIPCPTAVSSTLLSACLCCQATSSITSNHHVYDVSNFSTEPRAVYPGCKWTSVPFLHQKKGWAEHCVLVEVMLPHNSGHVQTSGPDVTLVNDLSHQAFWVSGKVNFLSPLTHLTILSNGSERCPFDYL